jgi:hypothetical protein
MGQGCEFFVSKNHRSTVSQSTDWYSSWESHFNKTEIEALLQFRKEHLPHIEDESHELDLPASQMLVNGMVAYGWGYNELAATHSSLTDCLRQYINLDELAYDCSLVITQPLRYSATGEDSDASQNKRRYDGPDNTERSVKRVQRPEGIEEPDISMMMQAHATAIMQQAQVLGVDMSMEMQPAQNSGRNADIGGGVACVEVGETGYVGAGTTCADVRGFETFGNIATDNATLLPGYMLQEATDAQQCMFPTYNTTSPSMVKTGVTGQGIWGSSRTTLAPFALTTSFTSIQEASPSFFSF